MIRTTPPIEGQPPYKWDVPSAKQCTWFCYFRTAENGQTFPCFFDRATRTGSYTNAKNWLENYREPWEVKGSDFKPSSGDIAVFTGDLGHVAYIEKVDGENALISDYNRVAPLTYASDTWKWGTRLQGCGDLIGYLHFPYNSVDPVERNTNVTQIQTTDDQLRIRTAPSLSAEIVGHVQLGYYNVLSEKDADGYTWYEISKDRWCANITTNYLPAEQNDFVRQLEDFLNTTRAKIKALETQNADMKSDMSNIKTIAERWSK